MDIELNLAKALHEGIYRWETTDGGACRVLRNVLYCAKPEPVFYDEDGHYYQSVIIAAPAAYIAENGTVNRTAAVNGYTADTAPVVFKNNCQGWLSSVPTFERDDCITTYLDYVQQGFVYVGCGARSRNLKEGKAPNPVVDLKAGVRFVRANAKAIPGNMDHIFSFGGSGAGQMSSVLGASGNFADYYPLLAQIGAMGIEEKNGSYVSTVSDAFFGCMVHYAIGDIGHIDLTYAWTRFDTGEHAVPLFRPGGPRPAPIVEFTPYQLALQNDMAVACAEYLNSLELRDADGTQLSFAVDPKTGSTAPRSGSFYRAVLREISAALNAAVPEKGDAEAVIGQYRTGGSLPGWLRENSDGSFEVTDLAGFLTGTGLKRNKNIPSFDAQDLTAENNAFGTREEHAVHYSAADAAVMQKYEKEYAQLEGYDAENIRAYAEQSGRPDVARQVELMNAVGILADRRDGKLSSDIAPYWRVRMGTADQHTTVPVNFSISCLAAANGADTDFALVWGMPHGREIEGTSRGTFIGWVDRLCKA